MKLKVVVALFALILSSSYAFAQSEIVAQKSDSLVVSNNQQSDSIYYGCVPCCKSCSVFKTDKPGECPHCGMILEKRTYLSDAEKMKENHFIINGKCEPPKAKKNKKRNG